MSFLSTPKKIWLTLVAAWVVYTSSLFGQFLWDDEQFIYKNQSVLSFNLKRIFSESTTAGAGIESNYFRPIASLSFAIDHQIWGLSPFGFHLTNLILHLASGWLLFKLLQELKIPVGINWFVMALFLLHPIQTEAVTYINSRGDSLYVFWALCCLNFVWLFSHQHSRKINLYDRIISITPVIFGVGAVLSLVMAVLSKELALGSIGLVWLIGIITALTREHKLSHFHRNSSIALMLSLVGVSYLFLRKTLWNFVDSFNFYGEINIYTQSLWVRLLTFGRIWFSYLQLLIFPYPLHMERSLPLITEWSSPWWILALLSIGLIVILGWIEWRKTGQIIIWLGLGWYSCMLLPVSGIVPINGLLYEHWLYLPIVGWGLIVGGIYQLIWNYLTAHWPQKLPQMVKLRNAAILLIFLLLSGLTIRQNYIWSDPIRFYEHTLKYAQSARLHNNLAMSYADVGKNDLAIQEYLAALEINYDYPEIHHNLGNIYKNLGQIDQAINEFQTAIKLAPSFLYSYPPLFELLIQTKQSEAAKQLINSLRLTNPLNNEIQNTATNWEKNLQQIENHK